MTSWGPTGVSCLGVLVGVAVLLLHTSIMQDSDGNYNY